MGHHDADPDPDRRRPAGRGDRRRAAGRPGAGPALLLFLALGMLAGSEGIGGIHFANYDLARTLGTIALVLILFEGGLTSGWSEIRPVLGTAASLATVGTLATALLAGVAAK